MLTGPHMAASSQRPKVSVLIPTYKYARYLPQAIESVLSQSFSDFELVISDDDSRDGSEDIIQRYAALDERIRFTLQSPNLGMVRNWNWCLEQARGTYIKYLFGDDFLISRDALVRLVELMQAHPDVRLASSARIVVDEHSSQTAEWNFIGREGLYDGEEIITCSLRSNGNLIGEPSVVMFRSADAGRGFNPAFEQVVDWEFWIRLLQGGTFAFTDEPLCAFRRHSQQQTEINRLSMGSASEHPRLIRQYSRYLVSTPELRQDAFNHARWLRRLRKPSPSDLEMANLLQEALGSSYYGHLLRYKISRPYYNVRRFWQKHILGKAPDTYRYQTLHTPVRKAAITTSAIAGSSAGASAE
jgi:glycosyltransferase involved in cell wall biosynthesis